MRTIAKELREQVPIIVNGQPTIVERDTYKVILFLIDAINERCNCIIARGFHHPETGLFVWEQGKWEVVDIYNERPPNVTNLNFYQFLADVAGTGDIERICGHHVMDWVADHAELLKANIHAEPKKGGDA